MNSYSKFRVLDDVDSISLPTCLLKLITANQISDSRHDEPTGLTDDNSKRLNEKTILIFIRITAKVLY